MKDLSGTIPSQEPEVARITALNRYKSIITSPAPIFNDLVSLVCDTFEVPMALIYFIGENEVFYQSIVGVNIEISTPESQSFFEQSIAPNALSGIENVPENPYQIHSYASAGIYNQDGCLIGSLCIMSDQKINFDLKKQAKLTGFAKTVMNQLELLVSNANLVDQNTNLKEYQEQTAQANNVLENVLDSYEMLFKYTPAAIGICSSADRLIWQANEALLDVFGRHDDLIGKSLDLLITDIDGEDFSIVLDQVNLQATAYHSKEAKLRIKYADGYKSIYVNLSLQPVGRMGDEPDNIMFIMADVTEPVISKQMIEEANIVLLNAIEDTGMGYTVVEFATGKMVSNDQLKANYGYYPLDEFNYENLFEAILPKYRSKVKKAVRQAVLKKSTYQAEYEVRWRDGSVHWIRGYGKPKYDENGIASHIIGFNKIISGPSGDK